MTLFCDCDCHVLHLESSLEKISMKGFGFFCKQGTAVENWCRRKVAFTLHVSFGHQNPNGTILLVIFVCTCSSFIGLFCCCTWAINALKVVLKDFFFFCYLAAYATYQISWPVTASCAGADVSMEKDPVDSGILAISSWMNIHLKLELPNRGKCWCKTISCMIFMKCFSLHRLGCVLLSFSPNWCTFRH